MYMVMTGASMQMMEHQGWKYALSPMVACSMEACLKEERMMAACLVEACRMDSAYLVEHLARAPWMETAP